MPGEDALPENEDALSETEDAPAFNPADVLWLVPQSMIKFYDKKVVAFSGNSGLIADVDESDADVFELVPFDISDIKNVQISRQGKLWKLLGGFLLAGLSVVWVIGYFAGEAPVSFIFAGGMFLGGLGLAATFRETDLVFEQRNGPTLTTDDMETDNLNQLIWYLEDHDIPFQKLF